MMTASIKTWTGRTSIRDDLVDDFEVGFVVLDDQEVAVGHRVAAGRRLVAVRSRTGSPRIRRHPCSDRRPCAASCATASAATASAPTGCRPAGDKRGRLADPESVRRRDGNPFLTDVDAQERPDHRQQLVGSHVVELVDPGQNPFLLEDLGVVVDLSLGVEVVDRSFLLLDQVGQLDHRFEHLVDGDAFEIGRDRAADLGRDEDIQAAATTEQLQELAHVELVDVHGHQAVAIELDLLEVVVGGPRLSWPRLSGLVWRGTAWAGSAEREVAGRGEGPEPAELPSTAVARCEGGTSRAFEESRSVRADGSCP